MVHPKNAGHLIWHTRHTPTKQHLGWYVGYLLVNWVVGQYPSLHNLILPQTRRSNFYILLQPWASAQTDKFNNLCQSNEMIVHRTQIILKNHASSQTNQTKCNPQVWHILVKSIMKSTPSGPS